MMSGCSFGLLLEAYQVGDHFISLFFWGLFGAGMMSGCSFGLLLEAYQVG